MHPLWKPPVLFSNFLSMTSLDDSVTDMLGMNELVWCKIQEISISIGLCNSWDVITYYIFIWTSNSVPFCIWKIENIKRWNPVQRLGAGILQPEYLVISNLSFTYRLTLHHLVGLYLSLTSSKNDGVSWLMISYILINPPKI